MPHLCKIKAIIEFLFELIKTVMPYNQIGYYMEGCLGDFGRILKCSECKFRNILNKGPFCLPAYKRRVKVLLEEQKLDFWANKKGKLGFTTFSHLNGS